MFHVCRAVCGVRCLPFGVCGLLVVVFMGASCCVLFVMWCSLCGDCRMCVFLALLCGVCCVVFVVWC